MQVSEERDYEKAVQLIRTWPEFKSSSGSDPGGFRKSMESRIKSQMMQRIAFEDPEKALALLSPSGDDGKYNYSLSGQVVQGLINAGKKEEASRLIDQTMNDFNNHANDPRALQEYESFVRVASASPDSARASAAVNQWVTQLSKQPQGNCGATLKTGDASVDLTCSESKTLNLLRGMSMKPGFVLKTLEGVPDLKSKLDRVGGIDTIYGGNTTVMMTTQALSQSKGSSPGIVAYENPGKLVQELKGKAETNPGLVRKKLQEAVKGPDSVNFLVNLAMSAAWQDPELASLALEVAQPLVSQLEPLQKRAAALQNVIRAYRQVDGSVDSDVLRNGFILADQIRDEASEKAGKPGAADSAGQPRIAAADQLEAFLVAELSKDSFDDAIRYARSCEGDQFKLNCFIQIVRALSSN
jgi:hypothetical protein